MTTQLTDRLQSSDGVDRHDLLEVSPLDFGAFGDNETDDTDAINDALDYIRTNVDATTLTNKIDLNGGSRIYRVDGSLNATGITGYHNWSVKNLRLNAHCAGKVVLDLADSRYGRFDNVMIYGNSTDAPYTGIQQCRNLAGDPASHHIFTNCSVDGYFTNAALHNYSSEECAYVHSKFWNRRDTDGSNGAWAAIFDGAGTKTVISDFYSGNLASGNYPFNQAMLLGCDLRKLAASGSVIFLTAYSTFTMLSPYMSTVDGAYWTIALTGSEKNFTARASHLEATGSVQNAVSFTGTGNKNVYGFVFDDHQTTCLQSFFGQSGLTRINLRDVDVKINTFDSAPSIGVFDDPSKYLVIGKVVAQDGTMNDLTTFAGFVGEYRDVLSSVPLELSRISCPPTYTVSGVPTASSYPRGIIYVSNETGGATLAFSDGTDWRRVQDRAIVS